MVSQSGRDTSSRTNAVPICSKRVFGEVDSQRDLEDIEYAKLPPFIEED